MDGVLSGLVAGIDPREMERKALAMLEDGPDKARLVEMHSSVRELDGKIAKATDEWVSLLRVLE